VQKLVIGLMVGLDPTISIKGNVMSLISDKIITMREIIIGCNCKLTHN